MAAAAAPDNSNFAQSPAFADAVQRARQAAWRTESEESLDIFSSSTTAFPAYAGSLFLESYFQRFPFSTSSTIAAKIQPTGQKRPLEETEGGMERPQGPDAKRPPGGGDGGGGGGGGSGGGVFMGGPLMGGPGAGAPGGGPHRGLGSVESEEIQVPDKMVGLTTFSGVTPTGRELVKTGQRVALRGKWLRKSICLYACHLTISSVSFLKVNIAKDTLNSFFILKISYALVCILER
ncbi:hypothetical protein SK128_023224 [Halocaridina rubra]|uniref:Uncharacterized protein n=1 Tax=Halocaridina rubra TaxID=373956 RepID=A0AAN8WZG4_HALRR